MASIRTASTANRLLGTENTPSNMNIDTAEYGTHDGEASANYTEARLDQS